MKENKNKNKNKLFKKGVYLNIYIYIKEQYIHEYPQIETIYLFWIMSTTKYLPFLDEQMLFNLLNSVPPYWSVGRQESAQHV